MASSILTELKLSLPVFQAPMAGVTKPRMVIASCKAGILGSLGGGMMQPKELKAAIDEIRSHTSRPFQVNLFVVDNFAAGYNWPAERTQWLKDYYHSYDLEMPSPSTFAPKFEDQLQVVLEAAPAVASFTFGLLTREQVQQCHNRGIKVIGTATSTPEALEWQKLGADAICAQGIEAGGHRGSFLDLDFPGLGLFALIGELKRHLKIPIIAAGGIMDGSGILAAISLGASAVQMGTVFLDSSDTELAAAYQNGIKGRFGHETELTTAFSGRYARGAINNFLRTGRDKPTLPYPVQNALTQPLRKASMQSVNSDNLSLWTGQGINSVRSGDSIATICAQLREEILEAQSKVSNIL